MYGRRLRLTPEGIRRIEESGEYCAEKLALEISRRPERFGDRLTSG